VSGIDAYQKRPKPWTRAEQEAYIKASGHDKKWWLEGLRRLSIRNFQRIKEGRNPVDGEMLDVTRVTKTM
jgi:hypothetical protein